MNDERWLPIPDHEDYEVSSAGRVRRAADRRVLALHTGTHGYVLVTVGGPRLERKPLYVHQLVLLAFRGPRPAGMVSRHLDSDRSNNHESNLRWGTAAENEADKIPVGRSNRGERNGRSAANRLRFAALRRAAEVGS